jgi:hypothetical protein
MTRIGTSGRPQTNHPGLNGRGELRVPRNHVWSEVSSELMARSVTGTNRCLAGNKCLSTARETGS